MYILIDFAFANNSGYWLILIVLLVVKLQWIIYYHKWTTIRWFIAVSITKTLLFKYTENFTTKIGNFQIKKSDIFHISAQNIDCGYSLELPHRGSSNEYPQSMFLSRNNKNNVYPYKPQFYYIKVGFRGSKLYRYVFVMLCLSTPWWFLKKNKTILKKKKKNYSWLCITFIYWKWLKQISNCKNCNKIKLCIII